MYKRILLLVLLFVNILFCSCSSEKRAAGSVVSHEDLRGRHYEMQSESAKASMKDNAKRSEENTPLKKQKKKFRLFRRNNSCDYIYDAAVSDGVRDVKM